MAITHNNIRIVTTAGGTVQVAGPNPYRVGVIIGTPNAGNPNLKFGEVAAVNDGIRLPSGSVMPWILIFDKPNAMITSFISIFFAVATEFSMIELMDRPD